MNYEGDLYGKVGGIVFKTGKTSKDWDNMEALLKELEAENLALKQANGVQASEATAILPLVSNRTFIVTIECGEDTTDWKTTAPNELAAKMTASANYNQKRFNILRCVEYGC